MKQTKACEGTHCPLKESCLRHNLFNESTSLKQPMLNDVPGRMVIVSYTKPPEWVCDKYLKEE